MSTNTQARPTTGRRLGAIGVGLLALGSLSGLVPAQAEAATAATASPTAAGEAPVGADGLRQLAAVAPVTTCAALATHPLRDSTGGAVRVASAKVVTPATGRPYCEVTGTIAPASTFAVRLPVSGWTQRYVQTGCGGLCGNLQIEAPQAKACTPIVTGTAVTASTDMGHQGKNDGSWASRSPQAVIDFAYRSVHETSVVAKALTQTYYGRGPAYSYFDGCSDGGREALMEAQRYPDDFDGIAAGAPANNMAVQNTVHHAWNVLANRDAAGRPILLADKLPLIHAAVLGACDRRDGVADGVVSDPQSCDFDPAVLTCAPAQEASTCLSAAQVTVVRRVHDGAVDARGRHLEVPVAHEWGSELGWTLFVPATATQTPMSENFALSFLRYLADPAHPRPDMKLSDFHFTAADVARATASSSYLSAMDPDLSAFRARGGRLLLWHGWNDQHIAPRNTLAYWSAMRSTMGGAAVDSFARLYMLPGVAHCGGGEGPNTLDVLTPVMAWVESSRAPRALAASSVTAGATVRTRPVYPYPQLARYTGHGSTDEAANFRPAAPTVLATDFAWLGRHLFSRGYQTTCRADGTELVCRRGTPA